MQEKTFLHLTDIHLGQPGFEDSHLHSDTEETLNAVIDLALTVTPKPSFVIASGDLSNRGDASSYRELKRIMSRFDIPVLYALGNHDTRQGFYTGMLDRTSDLEAPFFHDCVIDGVHIITLDSSTPNFIGGSIEREQFDWLAERLDAHSETPKLIVSHHPPALGEEPDLNHWRTIVFPHSQRLASMLKGRNVLGILSGHIHHDRVSIWHGIPVIVGTGQHAATDILQPDRLRMVRGASFGVGTIRPSGLTIAFVPMPSDRAEINSYPLEMLRDRAGMIDAAAF